MNSAVAGSFVRDLHSDIQFAVSCFVFRAVERNSERAWQKIVASSGRCPPLKKPRGAFKLEFALMRLYLTKPSKRR